MKQSRNSSTVIPAPEDSLEALIADVLAAALREDSTERESLERSEAELKRQVRKAH